MTSLCSTGCCTQGPLARPAALLLALVAAFPATGAPAGSRVGGKPRPPANLVVPEALKDARSRGEEVGGTTPMLGLGAPEVLLALGPWEPVVGHWAEYLVEARGGDPIRVRISILAERPGGRFWIEVVAAPPEGGLPMASRLLVHGHPARAQDVERMQLYIAGQSVLELPLEEALEHLDPSPPKLPGLRVEKLAPAEVVVRAGTFRAQRLRLTRAQDKTGPAEQALLYRAAEVPIFHLVKSETTTGTGPRALHVVTQLFAQGKTGAHSVFPANAPLLEEAPAPAQAPAPAAPAQGNGSEIK